MENQQCGTYFHAYRLCRARGAAPVPLASLPLCRPELTRVCGGRPKSSLTCNYVRTIKFFRWSGKLMHPCVNHLRKGRVTLSGPGESGTSGLSYVRLTGGEFPVQAGALSGAAGLQRLRKQRLQARLYSRSGQCPPARRSAMIRVVRPIDAQAPLVHPAAPDSCSRGCQP